MSTSNPIKNGFGPSKFRPDFTPLPNNNPELPLALTPFKEGDILIYRENAIAFTNEPYVKLIDGGNF